MATTYVFKQDYAVKTLSADPSELSEVTTRRWRVSEGDQLLLTAGAGLGTRFLATCIVAKLNETRPADELARSWYPRHRPDRLYLYTLGVAHWAKLPESRTLGEMMYSLERVTNFSRPSLNLRHHSRLSGFDVGAILNGNVDEGRSLYFGLLQYIPEPRRSLLDLRCQQATAAAGVEFDPARAVKTLLESLRESFILPVELAHMLHVVRTKLEFKEPLVATAPEHGEEWDAYRLVEFAANDDGAMVKLFEGLGEESITVSSGEGRKWRPHRW